MMKKSNWYFQLNGKTSYKLRHFLVKIAKEVARGREHFKALSAVSFPNIFSKILLQNWTYEVSRGPGHSDDLFGQQTRNAHDHNQQKWPS
jgi:hypothetical protein